MSCKLNGQQHTNSADSRHQASAEDVWTMFAKELNMEVTIKLSGGNELRFLDVILEKNYNHI